MHSWKGQRLKQYWRHLKKKSNLIYLDMPLFDLSILNVLSKVVADCPKGGMHLYAEIASEAYGSFICRAFLFTEGKKRFSFFTTQATLFHDI